MTMERKTLLWASISGIAAVTSAAVAVTAWLVPGFDPFGWQDAKLDAPPPPAVDQRDGMSEPRHAPFGNGLPTVVSFRNRGPTEALIQRVDFRLTGKRPTPRREVWAGALPALAVNFAQRHYDGAGRFILSFQNPQAVPGKEWATLQVAIIEPAWVGTTYVGVLTVVYDGGETLPIEGVEVDVLAEAPPRDST